MRRFVEGFYGKVVSALSLAALLTQSFVMFGVAAAQAQSFDGPIASLPQWAVVEFAGGKNVPAGLGKSTAEAVFTQLLSAGEVDPLSMTTVENKMTQMGIPAPVTGRSELLRLAQELRVSTIVSGELLNGRIVSKDGSKRAELLGRVIVWDVASGEPVNGAALSAASGVRAGDVSDETLFAEAANNFVFEALQSIRRNTLPTATVLNTLDRRSLINRGARSGFTAGQQVIIVRGREQVASGAVSSVEPDKAYIDIKRQTKGVQPGDVVRAVFAVPSISADFGRGGEARVVSGRRTANNAPLISLLLVVAGLVFLSSGSSSGAASGFVAEATTVPGSPEAQPAVALRWKTDGALRGNSNRIQAQIWRSDSPNAPVLVVPGNQSQAIDRGALNGNFTYYSGLPVNASFECEDDLGGFGVAGSGPALAPALAYTYSIEMIFRVDQDDLPGGTGGNTGGTTGGTSGGTTGGTTGISGGRTAFEDSYARMFASKQSGETGGTTGITTGGTTTGGTTTGSTTTGTTTGTDGATFCNFRSDRVVARGLATPFDPPAPRAPVNDQLISVAPVFRFESVRESNSSLTIEYALQFSSDPSFPAGPQTRVVFRFLDTVGTGTLSTPQAITAALTAFPGAETIYWRVGARNIADKPGPVAVGGERYIFGNVWRFRRPVLPPNP